MKKLNKEIFPFKYENIIFRLNSSGDVEIFSEDRVRREKVIFSPGSIGWFRYADEAGKWFFILASDRDFPSPDKLLIGDVDVVEKIKREFNDKSDEEIRNLILAYCISKKLDLED